MLLHTVHIVICVWYKVGRSSKHASIFLWNDTSVSLHFPRFGAITPEGVVLYMKTKSSMCLIDRVYIYSLESDALATSALKMRMCILLQFMSNRLGNMYMHTFKTKYKMRNTILRKHEGQQRYMHIIIIVLHQTIIYL